MYKPHLVGVNGVSPDALSGKEASVEEPAKMLWMNCKS